MLKIVIAKAAKRLFALTLLKRAGVMPKDTVYSKYTLVMLGWFLSMLRRYGRISLHTCLTLLNLYKEEL